MFSYKKFSLQHYIPYAVTCSIAAIYMAENVMEHLIVWLLYCSIRETILKQCTCIANDKYKLPANSILSVIESVSTKW